MIHLSITIRFLSLECITGPKTLATYAGGNFNFFLIVQGGNPPPQKKNARTSTSQNSTTSTEHVHFVHPYLQLPTSDVCAIMCYCCDMLAYVTAVSVLILQALALQIILNFSVFYEGGKTGKPSDLELLVGLGMGDRFPAKFSSPRFPARL